MDGLESFLRDIRDFELFGVPSLTLGIWCAAGLVAGALLPGKRPLGFLGDLIVGVMGGFFGGWLSETLGFDVADFVDGVNRKTAGYIGELLTALVGAIIVLLLLRMVLRTALKKVA